MKIRFFTLLCFCLVFMSCSDNPVTDNNKENPPVEEPNKDNEEEDKDDELVSKSYFTNPFINSDVPDICMIRVGEDYYMVSTTMYFMPGAPIMHSKDMVSWKIIGYVFDSLNESEANNLELNKYGARDIYSQGQWATSLRYYDGWFYAMFITGFNGEINHTYIYKTQDPAGKWELAQTLPIMHDSSLFFEDDGTPYIITGFGEIKELNADLSIKKDNYGNLNMNIEEGVQCEACQFFKVNGKYYAFFMYRPDNRKVLCMRANNLRGPYSKKVVLDDSGIAQGGIIDTPDGKWYGYFFQDMWPLGRCPYLVPCTWDDGWPVMGDENGDVPREMEVPVNTGNLFPRSEVLVNDDFDSEKLGLTWQWNHNPDNSLWSLTERPGYMRLKTGRVMEEDPTDIFHARNTLTQRVLNGTCSGRIAIDVSNMKNGDRAGLSAFNYYGGLIEVIKENNSYKLSMATYNQKMINGEENNERAEIGDDVTFSQDVIYLRTDLNYTSNKATFYYSLDGYTWKQLGGETTLIYTLKHFTGYRFAIFNYATKETGGYIDVDYFKYQFM